jgi:hypothetical protein
VGGRRGVRSASWPPVEPCSSPTRVRRRRSSSAARNGRSRGRRSIAGGGAPPRVPPPGTGRGLGGIRFVCAIPGTVGEPSMNAGPTAATSPCSSGRWSPTQRRAGGPAELGLRYRSRGPASRQSSPAGSPRPHPGRHQGHGREMRPGQDAQPTNKRAFGERIKARLATARRMLERAHCAAIGSAARRSTEARQLHRGAGGTSATRSLIVRPPQGASSSASSPSGAAPRGDRVPRRPS